MSMSRPSKPRKKTSGAAGRSIRSLIAVSFTLVAVVCMMILGVVLYAQSADVLRNTMISQNEQILRQMAMNINSHTRNMQRISTSLYYSVIKNVDLSEHSLVAELSLLYEVNQDTIVSISCFDESGRMVAAAPVSTLKPGVDVTQQDWFVQALTRVEDQHFSVPHVQNVFEENGRYHWVISLSRAVELTSGSNTSRGVLLVNMSYGGLEQIFTQMTDDGAGYMYLISSSGEIIYHPQQQLIYSGLYRENNEVAAGYKDGVHQEIFDGSERQVLVKSVGYTGWKVVSVIPNSEFSVSFGQMRLFLVAVLGLTILLLILVNSFVSTRVATPIQKLDDSVKGIESGNLDAAIYVGGPQEIDHLGRTVRSMVAQLKQLMEDMVCEQELKRKSEFAALQAQINPHFLYNTLDSIVWMIESGRYREAIPMVTSLARLMRISFSRGDNMGDSIILVQAELDHARAYLYIQNIRYKNKFTVTTEIDPAILDCGTIKLVIQPLLENAIYHAMEMMGGEGEIILRGYQKDNDLYLEVQDNGLGIPPEKLATLLKGGAVTSTKKGSGIGLYNVHQRIRLYYGEAYGLEIESELDEGTLVRIHLPVTYPEETDKGGADHEA